MKMTMGAYLTLKMLSNATLSKYALVHKDLQPILFGPQHH